ncbi:hypothetical protein ABEB36_008356 [Hypothenemus hampei]|uniref:C2 domain-containing protein n=1 Tax=Hypothenemus hampei TaxID=57062 RepID=A0ABD1ELK3_HYPHA
MTIMPQWKRLPSIHRNFDDFPKDFPSSRRSIFESTKWPSVQKIPEQRLDNSGTGTLLPYLLAASAATGLLLLLIVVVYMLTKRRLRKNPDVDCKAQSILVFPSNNGDKQPQFLTKEIHFSLPPLRSNSLGDLECPQNKPFDSDMDSDALLPAGQPASHRSNSFSCYGLGVIEPALYKSTLELDEMAWPDGHLGRIWFSLRYEPSTEKLLVSLLKAKNLPSRNVGSVNNCDPFIRLHLLPDERRYLQSKQKKKTCNPYFDETLVFQVSQKDIADHILKLSMIDGGKTKRYGEIGHVTYPLKELEIGDGSEQQLFKMDLVKEPQEMRSDLGELFLSLVYNENLSRLTATVIEAKGLKLQGDNGQVYVRITLHQHYRVIKEKRTVITEMSLQSRTFCFAEGFNFKMASVQCDVSSLAFHVFQHTSGYGKDKLIGKVVLGSYMFTRGKALNQWITAVSKPMEHCQCWHALTE